MNVETARRIGPPAIGTAPQPEPGENAGAGRAPGGEITLQSLKPFHQARLQTIGRKSASLATVAIGFEEPVSHGKGENSWNWTEPGAAV